MNTFRPYEDVAVKIRGVKLPVVSRKYHPMAHIGNPPLCGFADYDGLEADGSPGPGFAYLTCDDCKLDAVRLDGGPREFEVDRFIGSFHVHETEERLR